MTGRSSQVGPQSSSPRNDDIQFSQQSKSFWQAQQTSSYYSNPAPQKTQSRSFKGNPNINQVTSRPQPGPSVATPGVFKQKGVPGTHPDSKAVNYVGNFKEQANHHQPVNPTGEVKSLSEPSDIKLPPLSTFIKAPSYSKLCETIPQTVVGMGYGTTPQDLMSGNISGMTQMDMTLLYDNMMLGYFMPPLQNEPAKLQVPRNPPVSSTHQPSLQRQNALRYNSPVNTTHSFPSMHLELLPSPPNSSNSPADLQSFTPNTISCEINNQVTHLQTDMLPAYQNVQAIHPQCSGINHTSACAQKITQHTIQNVTSSGCTVLGAESFNQNVLNSVIVPENRAPVFENEMKMNDCVINASDVGVSSAANVKNCSTDNMLLNCLETPTLSEMSTVFMSPQETSMLDSPFEQQNSEAVCTETDTPSISSITSMAIDENISKDQLQYTVKDSCWGRFSVLPPVSNSPAPVLGEGDNVSMGSYSSINSNCKISEQQTASYYPSFTPFPAAIPDNQSSVFAVSPRYSARSSYSGRGSRNKRALSNSPLSAEGIDLNSIIRMSPTSLIPYINGSRSSSSCVSPGSTGEKTGCYGHLSARNSSSSPHSGSGSSGARRSVSYTPKTYTSSLSLLNNREIHSSNPDSITNSSATDTTETMKKEILELDKDMLILQAMQQLETYIPDQPNLNLSNNEITEQAPEYTNLQILPQDVATYRTENYIPFPQTNVPFVRNYIQPSMQVPHLQQQPKSLLLSHNKPPPTYDQHMARKALLQKKSSSDSSQPSNSNSSSFESSEGDKTGTGSGTDTEQNRMYECRWLDCNSVFQDQEEFVSHIEKVHIDQKKGGDFICFWRMCSRRLHPFNARYKLLMHMRVHSGDKPNKCTFPGCKKAFPRLENLKIHMRSHTGERPYSCPFPGCAKTFSNSSDRAKHQKTHQDTRPYVCQVLGCGKRYTDPSSLRKHAKSTHGDKREPGRKKIRGGIEELDPKDLNECLVIQAIKPIPQYDASPPEPPDSGLGRSPKGSKPGSSSDHYPGIRETFGGTLGEEAISRSTTALGSNHTSPSSHHSSPSTSNELSERERSKQTGVNRKVSFLPPIIQEPQISTPSILKQSSKSRPQSTTGYVPCTSSLGPISIQAKSPVGRLPLPAVTREVVTPFGTEYSTYSSIRTPCGRFRIPETESLPDAILDTLSRFEGVS